MQSAPRIRNGQTQGKSLYFKTIPATYVFVTIGYIIEFITTLPFAVLVWLDRRRR